MYIGRLTGFIEKALIGIRNQEANESKSDDIEEGDTPEDLLNGGRQRLTRISGLGGGKANKLRTAERCSRSDKDGAETSETMVECTRMVPVFSTNITTR